MNLALFAAAGITVSYGLATVLQSVGAKSTSGSEGLDPGLMVRLLRSIPYLIGLALDGAGFLLTVVALQSLPLFVVEAFTAGALAVTAVAAATWLKIPLSRGEWGGVAAVVAGLVALGLSAGADEDVALDTWQKWLPLVVGIVLLLLTFLGAKIGGRLGVTVLGALAGFGFGLVGIATRTLESPITVTGLLTDPSAYGIVVAGGVALLALATALQRGGVTQATAAMVVAETVIPSGIGLAFLGDRIRPGYEVVAGIGLLVAIVGAIALSRLGEIPEESTAAPVTGAEPDRVVLTEPAAPAGPNAYRRPAARSTATARPAADTGRRASRSATAIASRPSSPRASAHSCAASASVWSRPSARRASWSPWTNAPTPTPSAEQSAMASATVTRREPFSIAAIVGRLSPVRSARSSCRMPARARRARTFAAIT